MIVEMKKITVLLSPKQTGLALAKLRKIGIVHIKHMTEPSAHQIASLEAQLDRAQKAISLLKNTETKNEVPSREDVHENIKKIICNDQQRQKLISRCQELDKKLEWFKLWGNVSQSCIDELREKGIYVKLYACSRGDLRNIKKRGDVYIIYNRGNNFFCALLSTDKDLALQFQEISPPKESLSSVRKKIFSIYKELGSINATMLRLSQYKESLIDFKQELEKRIEFCQVRFGMLEQSGVRCLQGFFPKDLEKTIKDTADKEGWGYLIEEPKHLDQVPTLIRYPRWAKIIQPVFKFMGAVPGYAEFDISSWFLVFFSIFFAMLIGDGGYGLIFLGLTYLIQKKFPAIPRLPIFLFYCLGASTLLWGAVTGNWFGNEKILQIPLFKSLVIPSLNAYVESNNLYLMKLCFLLAATQLSIAHSWFIVRLSNNLKALAHIGWVSIIWGVYFLVSLLVLDEPMPFFSKYLFIGGGVLVVLFSNPQKNILKGIGATLGNLPFKLINSFADTLSYLRLFAIGYASFMIAVSFNQIAMLVGFSSVFRTLTAALILLAGHSLNILLGLMSVLVHGIRLNMLEFSGHLDMEWAGIEYQPFKE
ncbi:MAG: hypothetical protein JW867_05015 [Candidatus Omnitrophica bacterium]|nr:hypothetical protein [Candidatus Omnitrophota bacterium]